MSKRARIYTKSIFLAAFNAFIKAISADAKTKHGFNTHGAIVDELHAQPNRDLVDVLETSTGAREQPLVIHITTADFDHPSICNEKLDYAEKVRDGVIQAKEFLPVIYQAHLTDDWHDEATWKKANPNYGVSLKTDWFQEKYKKAVESNTFENTFKRLHLNIKTQQDVRWIKLERWDKCDEEFDDEDLKGLPCFAGLDIGSTADLTALCLIWPSKEAKKYYARWWFWCPKEGAEKRSKSDRVPYVAWAQQGYIKLTEGDETDYSEVLADIVKIGEQYPIEEIAADRLYQGAQLCQNLGNEGFTVTAFGQNFTDMAAPCQEFERLVNRGEFFHGGNPVMRWMASNVSAKEDPDGRIKPDKKKSGDKIDGIVAAIMALGRAMESDGGGSVYDNQGVDFL